MTIKKESEVKGNCFKKIKLKGVNFVCRSGVKIYSDLQLATGGVETNL